MLSTLTVLTCIMLGHNPSRLLYVQRHISHISVPQLPKNWTAQFFIFICNFSDQNTNFRCSGCTEIIFISLRGKILFLVLIRWNAIQLLRVKRLACTKLSRFYILFHAPANARTTTSLKILFRAEHVFSLYTFHYLWCFYRRAMLCNIFFPKLFFSSFIYSYLYLFFFLWWDSRGY